MVQGGNDWEDDEDELQDAVGPPQPLVAGPVAAVVQVQDGDAGQEELEEGYDDEEGVLQGFIVGVGGPQGSQGGLLAGALALASEADGAAGDFRAEGDEPMPMASFVR